MGASLSDAGPGSQHTPVLYQQVLSALEPRAGGHYIDGTLGGGGHARAILEAAGPDGELLGLDRDPQALALAAATLEPFGGRAHLRQATFAEMAFHASALDWVKVDGILLDLGLSSMQLDDPARGFSFRFEAPLDMRFDPAQRLTAAEIVNGWPEAELAEGLRAYGEEPGAGGGAQAIIAARPIRTTTELAGVVARAAGLSRSGVHPATQTFQALRIAGNEELEALERGRGAGGGLGRRFLRRGERVCVSPPRQPVCTCGHQATLVVPVRRPIRPEAAETRANPRARSARMRFGERLGAARSLHKRNRVGSSR